jgi:PadR family transcriptional regulator PadR
MAIGEFEYLLLATATALGHEAYGASIRKQLTLYGHPCSVGAVHTGLDRLEKKGLIVTHMGEATAERGGRAKRLVRVTAAGTKAASHFYGLIQQASHGLRWTEDAQ